MGKKKMRAKLHHLAGDNEALRAANFRLGNELNHATATLRETAAECDRLRRKAVDVERANAASLASAVDERVREREEVRRTLDAERAARNAEYARITGQQEQVFEALGRPAAGVLAAIKALVDERDRWKDAADRGQRAATETDAALTKARADHSTEMVRLVRERTDAIELARRAEQEAERRALEFGDTVEALRRDLKMARNATEHATHGPTDELRKAKDTELRLTAEVERLRAALDATTRRREAAVVELAAVESGKSPPDLDIRMGRRTMMLPVTQRELIAAIDTAAVDLGAIGANPRERVEAIKALAIGWRREVARLERDAAAASEREIAALAAEPLAWILDDEDSGEASAAFGPLVLRVRRTASAWRWSMTIERIQHEPHALTIEHGHAVTIGEARGTALVAARAWAAKFPR